MGKGRRLRCSSRRCLCRKSFSSYGARGRCLSTRRVSELGVDCQMGLSFTLALSLEIRISSWPVIDTCLSLSRCFDMVCRCQHFRWGRALSVCIHRGHCSDQPGLLGHQVNHVPAKFTKTGLGQSRSFTKMGLGQTCLGKVETEGLFRTGGNGMSSSLARRCTPFMPVCLGWQNKAGTRGSLISSAGSRRSRCEICPFQSLVFP